MAIFTFWFMFVLGRLFLTALVLALVFSLTYLFTTVTEKIEEEREFHFVVKVTLVAFLIFIFPMGISISNEVNSDSFKRTYTDYLIDKGIKERELIITDKDGNIIFEQKGNFTYSKDLNQITIIENSTGNINVFTIETDMSVKLEVLEP